LTAKYWWPASAFATIRTGHFSRNRINCERKAMSEGNNPKVAAVIVNYNAGEAILKALQCLADQNRSFSRIVVIDNNSTDGSTEKIKIVFPNVELQEMGENLGFAAANNIAVASCDDCELIALVNPDAFLSPNWLEVMLDAQSRLPDYGSFASLQLGEDGIYIDGCGDELHVSGLAWRRHHKKELSSISLQEEDVFSTCAAAAFYRRKDFQDAGGLDVDFFCYMDDIDLGFRLQLLGKRCRFIPEARAIHLGGLTSGVGSNFQLFHGHRNLEWVYMKNMPGKLCFRYFFNHLALLFFSLFWFSLKGKASPVFLAKWHAILGMKKMFSKRRATQQLGIISVSELEAKLSKTSLAGILKNKLKDSNNT
jgi:GT2 family glycosyltransferase